MIETINISKNNKSGYWIFTLSNNDKLLLTNEQYGELENKNYIFESTSGKMYSPLLNNKTVYFKVV